MTDEQPRPSIVAVQLPDDVLRQVYLHARQEFPAECCGWLSGARDGGVAQTVRRAHNAYRPGLHPTTDDRSPETAYVIDGQELLELDRSFGSDTPALVIYHSHPNGRAYFSQTDRSVALGPWGDQPMYPAQQLVVGIDATRVVEAKLFGWDSAAADFVEVGRFAGAEI